MILGMSTAHFTALHLALSLAGIFCGLVVLAGMLGSRRLPSWTAVFLLTTVLTSVTGFLFHSASFGPPHAIGILSLLLLAVCLLALYGRKLRHRWRSVYVVTALVALYLNVLVGVIQAFQKIPLLRSLAPTQSEAPFLLAQVIVLVEFVVLGARAVKRFHPENSITLAARISQQPRTDSRPRR